MTITYRATWRGNLGNDPRTRFEKMRQAACTWATGESPETLAEGRTTVEIADDKTRHIDVRTFTTDDGSTAFEMQTEDSSTSTTDIWMTVVRILQLPNGFYIAIENRTESDDPTRPIQVGRPRVVHSLLNLTENPHVGGSAVSHEVVAIPSHMLSVLLEVLSSEDRELPYVVCTQPPADDTEWLHRATRIAQRLEGIATVITLDNNAVTAFRRQLGDLAVWGGAIRVYMPTPVTSGFPGRIHRYYPYSRVSQNPALATDRVVQAVAATSARRRFPEHFRVFDTPIATPAASTENALSAGEFKAAEHRWNAISQKKDNDLLNLEIERDEITEDLDQAQEELARRDAQIERLKQVLHDNGLIEHFWGSQYEESTHIPDTVQDIEEAVLAAQSYLTEWLEIPEDAARDLEKLTTAPTASAWGNSTWRALRALATYAQDNAEGKIAGGFWEWCASGRPGTWPATAKKLSMTESDSVLNNAKARRARTLPVSKNISPDGQVEMLAHMKIAEGGGGLAPRVYFYDDTNGRTGKMHVGFIGPHYIMPNKSTN